MKFGPDGSLPRITSSSKNVNSNLKIAKITDEDGISKTGFLFKLVYTGENEESELSEKSDDEAWSEEDIPDTNPSEKDKSRESADLSNCNQSMVESRPQKVERRYNNNSRRNNRQIHHRYNENKNLHSSFNNPSNRERKNYNSNKRSFGSSGNYGNKYKTVQDTPQPWVVPPMVGPNFQLSFACQQPYMSTHMNSLMQAPPLNSGIENPVPQKPKSVGLLGDSPYAPPLNFPHRLDFQGEEFSSHPKKYQASNIKDAFLSHPPNCQLDYQGSKQNEEFPSHPLNYEPNSNNDEFGSPPVNYQASTSNEKFISCPQNFEATNENDELIPPPTNHQSKQTNKFRHAQNYYDEQYNSYPNNYSNRQRYSHYTKPSRGQFNGKNFNSTRRPWRNKNMRYVNNYNTYQSCRARGNDRRNANDHFDYRN